MRGKRVWSGRGHVMTWSLRVAGVWCSDWPATNMQPSLVSFSGFTLTWSSSKLICKQKNGTSDQNLPKNNVRIPFSVNLAMFILLSHYILEICLISKSSTCLVDWISDWRLSKLTACGWIFVMAAQVAVAAGSQLGVMADLSHCTSAVHLLKFILFSRMLVKNITTFINTCTSHQPISWINSVKYNIINHQNHLD